MTNWKEQFKSCLSFEKQVRDLRDPHMINLRIRINGEWREYEADWLKYMIQQEFPDNGIFADVKCSTSEPHECKYEYREVEHGKTIPICPTCEKQKQDLFKTTFKTQRQTFLGKEL